MEKTGEQFDGSELLPRWRELDELEAIMHQVDDEHGQNHVLTDRSLDSGSRVGLRAYIEASALISTARECQHLLQRTMVGDEGVVYPRATLNLIRPSFEAAITAYWILDPDDAHERRVRGLRQSAEDHRQSGAARDELVEHPDTGLVSEEKATAIREEGAKISQRFRDDADYLNVHWGKKVHKKPMNIRDDIKDLSATQGNPHLRQFLRYTWRLLSGVQHGLGYASVSVGQRLEEVKIPGGVQALVVTDDSVLTDACIASALVQSWAMGKYIHRTTQLSRPS